MGCLQVDPNAPLRRPDPSRSVSLALSLLSGRFAHLALFADVLPSDQVYAIVCLSHAGSDLEGYKLKSWTEAMSVLWQVATICAEAEERLEFEVCCSSNLRGERVSDLLSPTSRNSTATCTGATCSSSLSLAPPPSPKRSPPSRSLLHLGNPSRQHPPPAAPLCLAHPSHPTPPASKSPSSTLLSPALECRVGRRMRWIESYTMDSRMSACLRGKVSPFHSRGRNGRTALTEFRRASR